MRRFQPPSQAYPPVDEAAIAAVVARLRAGPRVRLEGEPELEAELAGWHAADPRGRAPIPWFVSSGTAALEAMLLGHGIGPGDEVVTTPYTWGATVSAILALGAIPVFADVDPLSGLLDPATVPPLLTPRSRALLVVHLFGQPVDLAACRALCDRAGILLLEDGSQAHGARWDDRAVGDWGDAAAFSCMGLKPLAGTEGGYALFRDPAAAERAFCYGKHPRGLAADARERLGAAGQLDALQLGWRPCTLSALLVRHALPRLPAQIAARRANRAQLAAALADRELVALAPEAPQAAGCPHLLSLVWRGPGGPAGRQAFQDALAARGCSPFHYIPTPIHRLVRLARSCEPAPLWRAQLERAGVDYAATRCPQAEWRSGHSVEHGFDVVVEDAALMDELAAVIVDAAQAAADGQAAG